jgi:hypothetical protein
MRPCWGSIRGSRTHFRLLFVMEPSGSGIHGTKAPGGKIFPTGHAMFDMPHSTANRTRSCYCNADCDACTAQPSVPDPQPPLRVEK